MNKNTYHYEVALSRAIKKNLIYSYPKLLPLGCLVQAPLRGSIVPAVVIKKLTPFKPDFTVRQLISAQTQLPALSPKRLSWLRWIADYYHYHLGSVIHLSFPYFLPKKLVSLKANTEVLPSTKGPKLTLEQQKCVTDILKKEDTFQVHFIHGVTGSGKTEIFFRLIAPALKNNQSALILVPEIALTPQHIRRFSERFPGQVACVHSGMSAKEKTTAWTNMLYRKKNILIGPRSALFCPLPNLSWIILDEEHETHFKQEEKCKYHARDTAIMLAQFLNIPIVLASATPSLESWWNIAKGKYHYHQLKKRVFQTPMPGLTLVDRRKKITASTPPEDTLPWWLSPDLHKEITRALKNKEQVALFLNRRGEGFFVFCPACGFRFCCPHCDISLTPHAKTHLVCHYCAWRMEQAQTCPQCQHETLLSFGLGTEQVQKDMKKLFPKARIKRADRDKIKNHTEWVEKVNQMENKQIDILIGTQMIAKGLDFPALTVVGILLADLGLNRPDFRAEEKSFHLLTQIAGRAGRRNTPGKVILQSYNPKHPVLQAVIKGDYEEFAKQELKKREKYHYPPFTKLMLIRSQAEDAPKALEAAVRIKDHLQSIKNLIILGPAPAPIFRLRNKYRYQLLLKSRKPEALHLAGKHINAQAFAQPFSVQVHINRDPIHL